MSSGNEDLRTGIKTGAFELTEHVCHRVAGHECNLFALLGCEMLVCDAKAKARAMHGPDFVDHKLDGGTEERTDLLEDLPKG